MGMLSDFFIADRETVPDYKGGDSLPAEDRCELKSVSPLEAAGMLVALQGSGDAIEMLDDFPLLTAQDADEWIFRVPDTMTSALAALAPMHIPDVARRCAEETEEELGWSPGAFEQVLHPLSRLAQRAASSGRSMYLWNSL